MRTFVKSFALSRLAERGGRVCEIGARYGETTDMLAALPNVTVALVDPCLDCDLVHKYANSPNVTVNKGISLAVLPELCDAFDCILIDGDHNWYTVYNELRLIFERNLLKQGGMIFFHDVGWPWGRRDMYYQPELIPSEYRHDWAQTGMVPGRSELINQGGFLPEFRKATHEGGPRNGVLTAIEDFLHEHQKEYGFFRVRTGAGLGILCRRGKSSDDLAFLAIKCKGSALNVITWPVDFAKMHFPSAVWMAKSSLRKSAA